MGKNCSSFTESYKERPLGHYSACAGRGQHASSSRQPLGLRCSRRLEATGNLMFGLSVLGLATVPLSIRTRRRTSILAAPMPVLAVGLAGCSGERGRHPRSARGQVLGEKRDQGRPAGLYQRSSQRDTSHCNNGPKRRRLF